MTVGVFRGGEALDRLAGVWRTLEAAPSRGGLSPFQRLAWARAWMSSLGRDAEPWILTHGDPPDALLPLVMVRRGLLRVVRFLGHEVSDYLGALPLDAPPLVYRAFGEALRREAHRFDLVDLQSLYADDAQRRALRDGLALRCIERVYERCPAVDTTIGWDAYLTERKKKFRANLKRAERRVAEQGSVRIEREKATRELVEDLVAVERASWKARAGSAFLLEPGRLGFLSSVLLDDPLPHEIWTLRIGDVLAAFAVVFVEGDVRFYYLPSFRDGHPDVGTRLLAEVVHDSFDGPWRVFDFLRGDEGYKLAWAHREQSVHQLVAAGRTWLGPLALVGVWLRWRLARSQRLHVWRAALRRRATGSAPD